MADAQIAIIDGDQTQVVLAPGENPAIVTSIPGPQGPAGAGVPTGGAANEVLYKVSSTFGDTAWGPITSAMIGDLQIVNADVSASAAIAGTKISPNFGSQNRTSTGTSTAASFIPTSSTAPTNGLYLSAANSVALSTNGTGRLFVDASGNVGIGVSPATPLDTVGTFQWRSNVGGTDRWQRFTGGTGLIYDGTTTNTAIGFLTNGAERLRITSTGQLSHIGAGSSGSPAVSFSGSAPSNSLVVDGTGNVGIGGAASSNILECRSPSNSTIGITRTASHNVTLNAISGGAFTIGLDGSGGSTERLRIDAAGRLGVGTLTPLRTLTSGGTIGELCLLGTGANGNTNTLIGRISSQVRSGSGEATSSFASIEFRTGTSSWFGDSSIAFLTNSSDGTASAGTERMRLTSTGLGIGTSSPAYTLDVVGSTSAARIGKLNILDDAPFVTGANLAASSNFGIGTQTASSTTIFTNNNPRVTITSAGLVGIGTTSPQGILDLTGTSRIVADVSGATPKFTGLNAAASAQVELALDGSALAFRTLGAEKARIDSSGRLLVGTSSQISSSTARLQVAGQILATGQISALPAISWQQTIGNPATDGIIANLERGKLYLISILNVSGALAVTPRMALYMVFGVSGTTSGLAAFAIGGDTAAFTVTAENVSGSFFNVRIAVLDSSRVFGTATATCVIG